MSGDSDTMAARLRRTGHGLPSFHASILLRNRYHAGLRLSLSQPATTQRLIELYDRDQVQTSRACHRQFGLEETPSCDQDVEIVGESSLVADFREMQGGLQRRHLLLLSLAQAVAVIRLGRKQVLVQRLQAVESLARVTVLASDKTGTLTTGAVTLEKVEWLTDGQLDTALAAIGAADEYPNATMKAIQAAHPEDPGWSVVARVPFDSTHKYSAVEFDPGGAWYVGNRSAGDGDNANAGLPVESTASSTAGSADAPTTTG